MPNFHASVEDFAALRAWMDDPFEDRTACLARAGLDERSYTELTLTWRARLARESESGGDLGRRFAAAYREAVTARRARAGGEDAAGGEDPRFLNRDAQPWREEAAQVGLVAPSAPPVAAGAAPAQIAPSPAPGPHAAGIPPAVPATRPQRGPAVLLSEAFETRPLPASLRSASAPVLPFTASQSPAPSAAPAAPHASREGLPFRSITPEPRTTPAPWPSALPAHLAGAVPAEGPNAPPNKRLIRFDPQTGQPLPFPVWVDVAPPEEERKR